MSRNAERDCIEAVNQRAEHVERAVEESARATEFAATHTVHWQSGPVDACETHARQLVGLARLLGSHVGVTAARIGAVCVNCQNEAAKHV